MALAHFMAHEGLTADTAARQLRSPRKPALRRARPRTSSSCSRKAGRARSISSIPSRRCRSGTASRCPPSMTKDLHARVHQAGREGARQPRVSSRAHGKSGDGVSLITSRTSPRAPTTSAWSARCTRTRSIIIPASRCCSPASTQFGRPTIGAVGHLRSRQRVARICRDLSC